MNEDLRQNGGAAAWLMVALAVMVAIAVLCLAGCASRTYVDWHDTANRHLSKMESVLTYSELSEPIVDKIIEMDERIERLEDKSCTITPDEIETVAEHASRKTREQFDFDEYFHEMEALIDQLKQ